MSLNFDATLQRAKNIRRDRLIDLENRDRLGPCLRKYKETLSQLRLSGIKNAEVVGLSCLTDILRGTYPEVMSQIVASGKTGIGATNSIKRSAGTNFQGLCEYAVLTWLDAANLPVAIGTNAPPQMKDELTIYGIDEESTTFKVEPDIDMSLWIPNDDPASPIIFVSAKTSLVDRAGQAARWKLYLDMHQTTCTHISTVLDCPINRTKIKIKTQHPIAHCIVTANIYKIDSTQPHGELESGQCKNNTYMFKHKYTTRNDSVEARPASWKSFSEITILIEAIFGSYLTKIQQQRQASHFQFYDK